MAANARDWWTRHRQNIQPDQPRGSYMILSPHEPNLLVKTATTQVDESAQRRVALARNCSDEGVRAGVKAGAVACVASAIPTLVGVRVIPWAKANLNHTAQALIISAATIATYFIVADKTILECARATSYEKIEANRAANNGNNGS